MAKPKGYVAIDVNEGSLECAASDGSLERYDISELPRIHHIYFEKRRKIQRRFWGNRRKPQKLQAKYRGREKHRMERLMHSVGKDVVERGKEEGFGIVLEDLKHMGRSVNRKALGINKFNGKVRRISKRPERLKRRLSSWSFRKLQGFIEYKARWEGIPVIYVNPKSASRTCPICGYRKGAEWAAVQVS